MHFGNHHLWWLGCSLGMAGVNMKNEPAFPFQINFPNEAGKGIMYHEGMTLRDYFAAKAMQGLITDQSIFLDNNEFEIAHDAYVLADAMLKERTK